MRHIANLDPEKVPRDEEFKFKQRAQALVDKWQVLAHKKPTDGTSDGINGKADDSMDVDGKDASGTTQDLTSGDISAVVAMSEA
jgi:hypothetical protein